MKKVSFQELSLGCFSADYNEVVFKSNVNKFLLNHSLK